MEHRLLIFQRPRTTVSFNKRPFPCQFQFHLTTFSYLPRASVQLPPLIYAHSGKGSTTLLSLTQAVKLKTAWPGSFTLVLINKNSPPLIHFEHLRLSRPGPALLEPKQAGSLSPHAAPLMRTELSLLSPALPSGLAPHTREERPLATRPISNQPEGWEKPSRPGTDDGPRAAPAPA